MPRRIAKVKQEYAGRDIAAGEAFEVEAEHVDILLYAGLIDADDAIEDFQLAAGNAERALDQDLRDMRRDVSASSNPIAKKKISHADAASKVV